DALLSAADGHIPGPLLVRWVLPKGMSGVPALGLPSPDFAFGVFDRVHGGVGGAEKIVPGGAVLGIEGNADACHTVQDSALNGEWLLEGAFEAECDLLDLGAVANQRQKHGKFVAAEPSHYIDVAQLALHARRNFLQVQVSELVAREVGHLFELVQVDVDQPEDAGRKTGLLNLPIQIRVQRETVSNFPEQVDLR